MGGIMGDGESISELRGKKKDKKGSRGTDRPTNYKDKLSAHIFHLGTTAKTFPAFGRGVKMSLSLFF